MKVVQNVWRRNMSSDMQHISYHQEVRKLTRNGFYLVHLGRTEFPESILNANIPPELGNEPTWSIIHAGGELGWVPWNYKLHFHLPGMKPKPDNSIFRELCGELRDHYKNCVIIVNPHICEDRMYEESTYCLYPTSVELPPMTCCSAVAQYHGHILLQLPLCYANISPLYTAWCTAKYFMMCHSQDYIEVFYYRDMMQRFIYVSELVNVALRQMTRKKWVGTMRKELVDWQVKFQPRQPSYIKNEAPPI